MFHVMAFNSLERSDITCTLEPPHPLSQTPEPIKAE